MSFEFTENVSVCFPHIDKLVLDSFIESEGTATSNKLVIEVAAIHVGLTSNYNNYTEAELLSSLKTWVEPYPKPILLNHDPESEPMGRVMAARMDKEADNTPFARLQVAVLDSAAIAKVLDQRYITGSVGGKATTAMCSICNTDWAKPSEMIPCKHKRGSIYSGKLAFFNLGGLSWKEYSFVNMPADGHSGVRQPSTEDGEWIKSAKLYSINMNKESILELNESENPINILEKMKKKEAHYTYMNVKGTFLTATAYDYKENMDTNITFNETNTTIDNELNTESPAQKSEEVKADSEEIVMSTEEKTEDFLSIVASLSADLASSQEETPPEDEDTPTEEASETDSPDAASDELSESSDEETDPEDKEIETKEDSEEEGTEETEEQLSENTDSTEEPAEQSESTEVEETTTPDEKDLTIESLTQENDKLKKALHFMLAERVVDTKITLGMVESTDRAESLKEHSTRTASSLADAIRDLEKLSVSTNLTFTKESITKLMPQKVHSVEEKENERVIDESDDDDNEDIQIAPEQKLEDILVNKLMNRTTS